MAGFAWGGAAALGIIASLLESKIDSQLQSNVCSIGRIENGYLASGIVRFVASLRIKQIRPSGRLFGNWSPK
jgi:hypothetical protein